MKILLSNDDGYLAPGLQILAEVIRDHAELTVVAPDRNCSGASHSLTLRSPLRAQKADNGFYFVDGTPSDCVHLAITELMPSEPDMVISGINRGPNLGDDVLYSGTVAAAMEGRWLGYPAMAVSLAGHHNYATAALVVLQLIKHAEDGMTESILNINVPDVEAGDIKGWQVTRLGNRHKSEPAIRDQDPYGETIFWVGPAGDEQDAGEGTDFYAVRHGYVSITPLKADLTKYEELDRLRTWLGGVAH